MDGKPSTHATRVIRQGGTEVRVLRTCTLEVIGPDGERTVGKLDRPVFRIGSHVSNDLAPPDPTISKHHLEVTVVPEGYRLVDLGSSNGTWLGDVRLGELTVDEALELRIGESTLLFRPDLFEVEVPASPASNFFSLVGRSVVMRELFQALAQVAATDSPVLLEGDAGTGKELAAHAIHSASRRAGGPFIVVDCAALIGSLVESELFGHVRGAFTGADNDRIGLLEAANGGTVFLDRVNELPLALQAKLPGVLERHVVQPVGTRTRRRLDVRVIASSRSNLAREVNEGRFRADLFYRLSVIRVSLPPLSARLDDLPLLVASFLDDARARGVPDVPPELPSVVMARLASQPWPGNVRELRNAIERALLGLPEAAQTGEAPKRQLFSAQAEALQQFEHSYFAALLAEHQGNVSAVARAAELDRRYLVRILKRLGLHVASKGQDPSDL